MSNSSTYNTYSDIINNVKYITSSSGLFIKNYDMLYQQMNNLNNMIEQYNDVSTPSIKRDIYDDFNDGTNWDILKEKLLKDIKEKPKNKIEELKPFRFKYNKLEPVSLEVLNNMNILTSDMNLNQYKEGEKITPKMKKNIRLYYDYKNDLHTDLNQFLDSVKAFENRVIDTRNANMTTLHDNIDILYNIHLHYAYDILHKKKPSVTEVIYNDGKGNNKIIPIEKSQSKFIKNAIKIMLDINE